MLRTNSFINKIIKILILIWFSVVVLTSCGNDSENIKAEPLPGTRLATTSEAQETVSSNESTISQSPTIRTDKTVINQTGTAKKQILIFTKTAGFRHGSIPEGINEVTNLAEAVGLSVTSSENSSVFNEGELKKYAAVVFLSTSGDILDTTQQAAFENYIKFGGGFVGIHAASDTEYNWPWYGKLVGAYFQDHPLIQNNVFKDCHCFTANVKTEKPHLSTSHLPKVWSRRDEWYNFKTQPQNVNVHLTVDEKSYSVAGHEHPPFKSTGKLMGDYHPVTWSHENLGGRSWYTAMGHTNESFNEPNLRTHIQKGLQWVVTD